MNFSESLKQFQRKPLRLQLVGYPANPQFYALQEATEQMASQMKGRYQVEVTELHESEYDKKVKTLKRKDPHFSSQFKVRSIQTVTGTVSKNSGTDWVKRPPFLMVNDKAAFNMEEVIPGNYSIPRTLLPRTRHKQRAQKTLNSMFVENQSRSYAFIDFESDGTDVHIVIELFKSYVPKTCQNFIELLQGTKINGQFYGYKGTPISRIKRNGFIQGGNIDGRGGLSIYGKYFEDESFIIKHDEPGIVGMANTGKPHSNGSQFYITLAPLSGFDGQKVAFGKVIVGLKALQQLIKNQPFEEQIPIKQLRIRNCGIHKQSDIASRSQSMALIPLNQLQDLEHQYDIREPEELSPRHNAKLKRNFLEQLYIANKLKQYGPDSVTLTTFLIQEQQKIKEATGDFTAVVDALQNSFRKINSFNSQLSLAILQIAGIRQKTVDVCARAKQLMVDELLINMKCALLYCLDDEEVITIDQQVKGKYLVVFRALDINRQVEYYDNTSIPTSMFLILKKQTTIFKPVKIADLFQSGENVISCGYCLYGQSTQIVIGIGYHTNIFSYDLSLGEFILSNPKVLIPQKLGVYAFEENLLPTSDENVKTFITKYKSQSPYTSVRFSESLYVNLHRILLYGGVCLYPQPTINIFEVLLTTILLEKAWGSAFNGRTCRSQLIKIENLSEKSQLFFGIPGQIQYLENMYLNIRKH